MAAEILTHPSFISIISPVYNAETVVKTLVERIREVCDENNYAYEIILVDDHSKDKSWNAIQEVCRENEQVKGFKLSKNFGQHYAITAGIHNARGEVLIIMDCDLQDNPKYIPDFIKKYREGNNIVCSIKERKQYSWYRNATSDIFFMIIDHLSDVKLEKNLGTFTLIDSKVAEEFKKIKDYHRHTSMIFAWLGFKRGYVKVVQDTRYHGKSSYNLRKLIAHAINGVISQSDVILKWSIFAGLFIFCMSILGVFYIIILSMFTNYDKGWPSLFVLILFSTGIILFMMGILGLYIGKIFEQVKERPLYIIEEKSGK